MCSIVTAEEKADSYSVRNDDSMGNWMNPLAGLDRLPYRSHHKTQPKRNLNKTKIAQQFTPGRV